MVIGKVTVWGESHRGPKVAESGESSELEIRPSRRSVGRTAAISAARMRERRASHGCGGYRNPGNVSPLDDPVAHGLQQAAFRSRDLPHEP
jgi:hypothetical protein